MEFERAINDKTGVSSFIVSSNSIFNRSRYASGVDEIQQGINRILISAIYNMQYAICFFTGQCVNVSGYNNHHTVCLPTSARPSLISIHHVGPEPVDGIWTTRPSPSTKPATSSQTRCPEAACTDTVWT